MSQTLEQHVAASKVIQEFIKHPGMQLLVEKLNHKVDLKKQAWLNATTPEEAEAIRQNSRAYAALMGTLNEFLAHGSQAEKALAQRANQTEAVPMNDASKGQ